jgi:hypothetical protein
MVILGKRNNRTRRHFGVREYSFGSMSHMHHADYNPNSPHHRSSFRSSNLRLEVHPLCATPANTILVVVASPAAAAALLLLLLLLLLATAATVVAATAKSLCV